MTPAFSHTLHKIQQVYQNPITASTLARATIMSPSITAMAAKLPPCFCLLFSSQHQPEIALNHKHFLWIREQSLPTIRQSLSDCLLRIWGCGSVMSLAL